MSYNAFNGFNFVDINGFIGLLEIEEITDEDRFLFIVYQVGEMLELVITTCLGSQLKRCNNIRSPCVSDTILAKRETSYIGKDISMGIAVGMVCFCVHADGIFCNFAQSDTADSRYLCTEILAQKILAETYTLKELGSSIGTNSGNAHLGHYFVEAFVHCLDEIVLGSDIVFLYLFVFNQIINNRKSHIGIDG